MLGRWTQMPTKAAERDFAPDVDGEATVAAATWPPAPTDARVFVLYTGGTIGMAPALNDPTGPLRPQNEKEFHRWLPPAHLDIAERWTLHRLRNEKGEILK